MKDKNWLFIVLLTLISVTFGCVKDKIDYVENNLVYGTVFYDNVVKGRQPLPPGQHVKVLFNNIESSIYSFNTTDSGRYRFSPFVKGNYNLQFNFNDSLLQYNASLVEKIDLDTLRKNALNSALYSGFSQTFSIKENNKNIQENITLQYSGTGLRIRLFDEKNNLLQNARVCIYSNESFASQNSPYCGGSIGYLSSDKNGEVIFTGLQEQPYYINARADIGLVHVTNKWLGAVRSTDVLQKGKILTVDVNLK